MHPTAALGLSRAAFAEFEATLQTRTFRGRTYRYQPDGWRSVERGTALLDDVVVRGFPKVPRTLTIETGVPTHFDGPVVVEEKLNGYNVRVVRVGDVFAFTRSGIICPFTTWLVRERVDLDAYFDAHPDSMLCGEVYGMENPYTTHAYPKVDGVEFAVFDVRNRANGTPVGTDTRRARCAEFDLPVVTVLGTYELENAPDAIRADVEALDDAGREGIVMKSLDGDTLLKYTTSTGNQEDLAYAFSLPFEHGRDFMFRRIIREAFQAVEFEEDEPALADRGRGLGDAILGSMVDAIEAVDAGDVVGERHTVRAPPTIVAELLAHLRDQGLSIIVESDETTNGERAVTFIKRARSTNDKIALYRDGHIVQE